MYLNGISDAFWKAVSDYYELNELLAPSYRIYWNDGPMDIPADYQELKNFESIEPGSGENSTVFLAEAAYKYEVGINKLVYKPGQSLTEFLDWDTIKGAFRLMYLH